MSEVDDPHPPNRVGAASRLATPGWVVAACATLSAMTLLLGAGSYLTMRSAVRGQALVQAEAAAADAAKACVIATQAPNVVAMAASRQKIIDCATGDFAVQATLYSGVLVDAYDAAKAQVQVTDVRAAAERHNDDGSVDVLVALRVKVSNATVRDQETGYRLRVRMALDDGVFKIARLDQVTS